MAPLNKYITPTLYIELATPFGRHTTHLRFPVSTNIADAVATGVAYCNAVKDGVSNNCVFDKARWRAAGSNLSFSTAWTPIAGTNGSPLLQADQGTFVSWTGRNGNGRRVRVTQFGIALKNTDGQFRYTSGEQGTFSDVLSALQSAAAPVSCLDGTIPVWNSYMNYGINAYFQRKARKSG